MKLLMNQERQRRYSAAAAAGRQIPSPQRVAEKLPGFPFQLASRLGAQCSGYPDEVRYPGCR